MFRRLSYAFFFTLAIVIAPFSHSAAAASRPVPSPPKVSAESYLIQDFHSGHVLAERGADEAMEPASITKLMTAYIVFGELKAERLTLDEEVVISEKAWRMPGSRTFVEVDSRVPVETLLKGMIVQSGNDATLALAEQIAGSEETFASLMNQKAEELGMRSSHFVNSTGLPAPEHQMTARDIATLTRALIRDFPEYYEYYSQRKFSYNGISQYNRNKLLWRDDSVDGVKTGHTDSAGYCLVSSAERDGMRLITVVLGDRDEEARADSSLALLNYGFRFFETRKLYEAGKPLKEIRIWKGASEMLPLGLSEPLYVTIPRGQYDDLNASISYRPDLMAPAKRHAQYGTLSVSLETDVIAERPLIALEAVGEGGLWQRVSDSVRLWFH